jgi:hypothetical protein
MAGSIENPQIAAGFAALSRALNPDPSAMIEADLNRRRGGLIDAQALSEAAQGRSFDATAGLRNTEASQIQGRMSGLEAFAAALTGLDMSTQEGRAALAAAAAQAGLDPQNMTGSATFVNPNFASPNDFSNILLGTGVVNGFGDTPTGAGNALANAAGMNDADNIQSGANNAANNIQSGLNNTSTNFNAYRMNEDDNIQSGANNDADNAATMERLLTERESPAPVAINEGNQLFARFMDVLTGQMPAGTELDPMGWQSVRPQLEEAFARNNGNASAAIAEILGGLATEEVYDGVDTNGMIPGGRNGRLTVPVAPARGGPAPVAAPTAAPAAPQTPPGTRAQLADGTVVVFDGTSWVAAPGGG